MSSPKREERAQPSTQRRRGGGRLETLVAVAAVLFVLALVGLILVGGFFLEAPDAASEDVGVPALTRLALVEGGAVGEGFVADARLATPEGGEEPLAVEPAEPGVHRLELAWSPPPGAERLIIELVAGEGRNERRLARVITRAADFEAGPARLVLESAAAGAPPRVTLRIIDARRGLELASWRLALDPVTR